MKVLYIGGTGNISTAVSKLTVSKRIELFLLNRGTRKVEIRGSKTIIADISKPEEVKKALKGKVLDVVVNWIAFNVNDIERDLELFRGKTKQYIFISSASVYQKPLTHPFITESTPLCNPFWEYSRNKIACEERLNRAYREEGFPITIVRPSLTYDTIIPVAIGGLNDYTIVDRMKKGKKIIVHGDGSSLWTITHSEDFAKGFVGLLGHTQALGHAFHITSDEILTWDQIYQTLAEVAGVKANIIHIPSDFICLIADHLVGTLKGDKAASVIFDNSKIKMFVPEFKATIPLKVGIRRTLDWFESNKSRMKITGNNNQLIDKIIEAYEKKIPGK